MVIFIIKELYFFCINIFLCLVPKAGKFISLINDPKKQLFTNEKFYKYLSEQSNFINELILNIFFCLFYY
jgi:hypothetical protein